MVNRIAGHSRRQIRPTPDLRQRTLAPGTAPRSHPPRLHARHPTGVEESPHAGSAQLGRPCWAAATGPRVDVHRRFICRH
jgi:hypothetical protein